MPETPEVSTSEQHLVDSDELHRLTPGALLALFEDQDTSVVAALKAARASIQSLGLAMADAVSAGGRIVHVGAGTSGRLGALDAAEWPPTFGIAPARVVAVVAGGDTALRSAVEGAEDDENAATRALERLGLCDRDLLVGLTASGRTPFVRAALRYARQVEAGRALVTTDLRFVDDDSDLIRVLLDTGPELLSGSTRLKAATATHGVLQRASMVCAVTCGWTHAGEMVEMRPTNEKLRHRALRIVSQLAAVDGQGARTLLERTDWDIKVALVCHRLALEPSAARARLAAVDRRLDQLPGFQ